MSQLAPILIQVKINGKLKEFKFEENHFFKKSQLIIKSKKLLNYFFDKLDDMNFR